MRQVTISGISHVTFAVRDLERSFRFYSEALGLEPVVKWRHGAYLLAGPTWLALSQEEEPRPAADYSHLAFAVELAEFAGAVARLEEGGAREWQVNASPGDSFYFLDPDGHKLELHASTLASRLGVARGSNRWEDAIYYKRG